METFIRKVRQLIGEVGRAVLVEKLGYKNTAKGLRKLDSFLAHGEGDERFAALLGNLVGMKSGAAIECLRRHKVTKNEQERRQQDTDERRAFRPHIWVETDGTGTAPVFIKALISMSERIIPVPSAEVSREEIRQLICDHFEHKGQGGLVRCFGKVTGYVFRKTYDENHQFSVTGEYLGKRDSPVLISRGIITHRGRQIF